MKNILYTCLDCGFFTKHNEKMKRHKIKCIDQLRARFAEHNISVALQSPTYVVQEKSLVEYIEEIKKLPPAKLSNIDMRLLMKQSNDTEITQRDIDWISSFGPPRDKIEYCFSNYSLALLNFKDQFLRFAAALDIKSKVKDVDTFIDCVRQEVSTYAISLYRSIYFSYFHDNMARDVELFIRGPQIITLDLVQLLRNLWYLAYDFSYDARAFFDKPPAKKKEDEYYVLFEKIYLMYDQIKTEEINSIIKFLEPKKHD